VVDKSEFTFFLL